MSKYASGAPPDGTDGDAATALPVTGARMVAMPIRRRFVVPMAGLVMLPVLPFVTILSLCVVRLVKH